MAQQAYNAHYHELHRDRLNAKLLARRNANPDRWREAYRSWEAANKRYNKQRLKDYELRNRPRLRAAAKQRRDSAPEVFNERQRVYRRKQPPGSRRAEAAQQRARKRGAAGRATKREIAARMSMWGERCSYCGELFEHVEHAIALARGGTNWPANLRPSCAKCNLTKGVKSAFEFISSKRKP